jgi:hypothetical protein
MEDLLFEYWEDFYDKNPEEHRKVLHPDGKVVFDETGDNLLDKWEAEVAQGLVPDLEEGMSKEERERLRQEREKARAEGRQRKPDMRVKQSQYESKSVARGSREEAAMLQNNLQHKVLGHGKSIPSLGDAMGELLGDADDWEDMLGE